MFAVHTQILCGPTFGSRPLWEGQRNCLPALNHMSTLKVMKAGFAFCEELQVKRLLSGKENVICFHSSPPSTSTFSSSEVC
jgi:hypothetical protein